MQASYLYIWILLGTLLGPLCFSFLPQIRFYKKWGLVLLSNLIVALLFIPWDVWYTFYGVWGFNTNYISGLYVFTLPIEEVFFFVVIPFACIFVYECIRNFSFFKSEWYLYEVSPHILRTIALLFFIAFWFFADRAYTASVLGGLSILLFVTSLPSVYSLVFWGRFCLAYIILLIPFLIVNGLLTAYPVVWYDDTENLSFRIMSIPLEDFIYQCILFLLNVVVFNFIQSKKSNREKNHCMLVGVK